MTIYTSHSCPSDGKTIARDMSVVRIAECFKEYIITANHPNTRMYPRRFSVIGGTSTLHIPIKAQDEKEKMWAR